MKRILIIICLFAFMGLWLVGCKGQKEETKTSPEETQSTQQEESQQKDLAGKKVVMIIAPEDFRDEELIEPQNVLTEKGAEVKVASVSLETCKGMLGAQVKPNMIISDIIPEKWDAIILIGGTGASKYWDDASVHSILNEAVKQNKIVGAICIAPVTCANAGILTGKKATVYETEASRLKEKGAEYTGASVQRDGRIITANGPQAAKEFGETVATALKE
ncbi:MAG TPA: DJ-1/PfpI family protein [candidate division Zixibacteria bacterium]